MLGDDAGRVLHRQAPAGEVDHAAAELAVEVVERGAARRARALEEDGIAQGRDLRGLSAGRIARRRFSPLCPRPESIGAGPERPGPAPYPFGGAPAGPTAGAPALQSAIPSRSVGLRVSGAVAPSAPQPPDSADGADSPARLSWRCRHHTTRAGRQVKRRLRARRAAQRSSGCRRCCSSASSSWKPR